MGADNELNATEFLSAVYKNSTQAKKSQAVNH